MGLVLGGGAGAAGVFDVDVLDGGAEVGEAPGDVVVVAGDDEGNAGEGDSGGVEIAGGGEAEPLARFEIALEQVVDGLDPQLLFRAEVIRDQLERHAGIVSDRAQRRAFETLLGESIGCGLKKP